MENILQLKTIQNLTGIKFFIPSYQRGYRWSVNEVVDLLNDVSDFKPKEIEDKSDKTWYCLQPIVITKKLDTEQYEVIDGQQRLTTIYLILYFLNQQYTKEFQFPIFELEYETRPNSASFLRDLKNEPNSENIDFHYISQAYNAISEWFKKPGFDRNDFQSKFNFNTKVIWYESIEDDPIAIFTRINIGKIPLSNAELIKALFLNSSNFEGKKHSDKIRLKQIEISSEWDQIEQALRDNRFWYFIGGEAKINRIEFILNLMNSDYDPNDNYSTFRFFNKKFENKSQAIIESNWIEIKNYFQRFNEWFKEKELYHKIGYLISCELESIQNLVAISSKSTKTEFRIYLDELIRKSVRNVSLDDLQYGDGNVKRVLLLYNIQTMLNNHSESSFFPFDLYKEGNWDIEHITSVNDSMPEGNQQALWLSDAVKFVEDQVLKAKIESYNSESDFNELFAEIVAYFNKDLKDSDINDISNLTLLDSQTNRGYKNAVFPLKRMTIIKREKEGAFIPLCTKNVFLKYFSDYPPTISFWSQEDRENYFNDLVTILNPYLS